VREDAPIRLTVAQARAIIQRYAWENMVGGLDKETTRQLYPVYFSALVSMAKQLTERKEAT